MDTSKKINVPSFKRLSYENAKDSIKNMIGEGSKMKREIFKASLMSKKIDNNDSTGYLNAISDFLRLWDEHSKTLSDSIKTAEGREGVYTLEFQFIKDFVYAKYDYASILPFADGVIKGVTSGKFNSPDDIKDFYNYTIAKAFDNNVDTAAGLLDIVSENGVGISRPKRTTALDAKSFDSIRNYDMFKKRDRQELSIAITKVIQFISSDITIDKYLDTKNAKLFISIINNIIDYITYSLAIYALRIYAISSYASPFITGDTSGFAESAVIEQNLSHPESSFVEISIFKDLDEMIYRDPDKYRDFFDAFFQFIQKIGAAETIGGNPISHSFYYTRPIDMKNNRFNIALSNNPLLDFIGKNQDFMCGDNEKDILSLNRLVKTLIYNSTQGLQDSTNAKHELLHVIRGTDVSSETLKDYRSLSRELYIFTVKFCGNLQSLISMISSWKSRAVDSNGKLSTGAINSISETSKILREFYRDITAAIVSKARDLETRINKCQSVETSKVINSISIKLPNEKNKDDLNNAMMTAVPDTTRIPIELSDIYELPTYESLQMYDEYAKYILGDIDYYSEAVNISELINKIFAKIKSAVDRFRTFWMDKNVQSAIKWVNDHEQEIISMDFSTVQISDVLPYKVNVGLPKNFSNLEKGLANIKEEHLKNSDELDKFIKSLYPSQEIYNWFTDPKDSEHKSGHLKYRSLILFKDENEVMDHDPEKINLNGSQISNSIRDWVNTMKTIKNVYDSLEKIKRDIESGMNKVKLVSAGIDRKNEQEQSKTQSAPPIGSDATDEKKQTTQQQNSNDNKMANNINLSEKAILEIQLATARLFEPLSMMFVEYIKSMYHYIQEAYSKGRKK